MHDLYYKGRIYTRKNHVTTGSDSSRIAKLGTVKNPLTLVVNSDDRKIELATLVTANEAFADITVDSSVDENIISNFAEEVRSLLIITNHEFHR